MSAPPEKPRFWQIYREEYRKVSASAATRAFRIITPAVLLIVAIASRHSSVILIVLGVLAGLLVAGAVIWGRRH
jgi:hypothetical protein